MFQLKSGTSGDRPTGVHACCKQKQNPGGMTMTGQLSVSSVTFLYESFKLKHDVSCHHFQFEQAHLHFVTDDFRIFVKSQFLSHPDHPDHLTLNSVKFRI